MLCQFSLASTMPEALFVPFIPLAEPQFLTKGPWLPYSAFNDGLHKKRNTFVDNFVSPAPDGKSLEKPAIQILKFILSIEGTLATGTRLETLKKWENFTGEAVGKDRRHLMEMINDDNFIALVRPDPPQDVYGRILAAQDAELTHIGNTLGFLQVCWVNACRDSSIYRKGVCAMWDLKVTLRPHHAVPQKALSTPIMSGHWGGYSSPSSWQQTMDGIAQIGTMATTTMVEVETGTKTARRTPAPLSRLWVHPVPSHAKRSRPRKSRQHCRNHEKPCLRRYRESPRLQSSSSSSSNRRPHRARRTRPYSTAATWAINTKASLGRRRHSPLRAEWYLIATAGQET